MAIAVFLNKMKRGRGREKLSSWKGRSVAFQLHFSSESVRNTLFKQDKNETKIADQTTPDNIEIKHNLGYVMDVTNILQDIDSRWRTRPQKCEDLEMDF